MLALSLKEPWLQMILEGRKTLETRTWKRAIDADVLLVSSLALDCDTLRAEWPHAALEGETSLRRRWRHPLGHARAVVHLVGARHGRGLPEDDQRACCSTAGRWLYAVSNVRILAPTFAVRGQLGFFEVDVDARGGLGIRLATRPAAGAPGLFP